MGPHTAGKLAKMRALFHYVRDLDPSLLRSRISELLGWAFVFLLACVGLWVIKTIPRWQVNEVPSLITKNDDVKQFELEDEARKTLSQIVLGAFGLIALFFTWRRVRAGDRNVRVMEQGHITDRYTKAIEQLGKLDGDKPNIEVRLGGIYALERIARDSPRDHWTIMEVLTAYVRQNAPAETSPLQLESGIDNNSSREIRPRTDIQAILTVLGRRERGKHREKAEQLLDLKQTNLAGADLRGTHLEGAYFTQANLERARFIGAYLRAAKFMDANLEYADLMWAHLEYAYFTGANLEDAGFIGTNLEHAYFRDAHLERAGFIGANLEHADFRDAHLEHADFRDANLAGADLTGANLAGAENLTIEQIKSTKNWEFAYYDSQVESFLRQPRSSEVDTADPSKPRS
jgi:uncharacterized protein YjbI with pentapeptide repeats